MADERRLRRALEELSRRIDKIAAEVCARHYGADTQEHQLTAKIADAIEREMGGTKVDGYTVGIAVQDLPDKGRGSLERRVGADLYISLVLYGEEEPISKGMLVQAKWDKTFSPGQHDVTDQLTSMLMRTEAAYVWVYHRFGVKSIPALDVMHGEIEENAGTAGQLIADGLACEEGDPLIGRDTSKALVPSLNQMLRELATNKGVAITVRPRSEALKKRRRLK
jgi:hypothetical protein